MSCLNEIGGYEIKGFIDNTPNLSGQQVAGVDVLGSSDDLSTLPLPDCEYHIAIGDNLARYRILQTLQSRGLQVSTIIHPTAVVSKDVVIGEGCFISANAVVGNGARIGCVSLINTASIIEHNSEIGDAVHVAPGVHTGGCVTIGNFSFLGLGATILPNIVIGSGAMVGAGAIITKEVEPNNLMMGYAARPHNKNIYADLEKQGIDKELLFINSAVASSSGQNSTKDCLTWLKEIRNNRHLSLERIPFAQLDNWWFEIDSGNLVHRSRRFFSIEGVQVRSSRDRSIQWSQPIINQPEIGVLGIVAKSFDGVLHFLLQAKVEPGNIDAYQLSPTIQATKSNFLRVHQGREQPYLRYFNGEKTVRVLVDQLQSEQGARFFRKRNRNIIVQVDEVPIVDDTYCWLTLAQIKELIAFDNVVNMDTRSVISTIPFGVFDLNLLRYDENFALNLGRSTGFKQKVLSSLVTDQPSLIPTSDVLSWITSIKARQDQIVEMIPLREVICWENDGAMIHHKDQSYFSVIAVDIKTEDREVKAWSQPFIEPSISGLVAIVVRDFNGVLHCLMQAKFEPGNLDMIELAPTIQCRDVQKDGIEEEPGRFFFSYVKTCPSGQIRYSTMQSEEGGRFFREQNHYMIIEAGSEKIFDDVPPNFCWMSLRQIGELMRHSNYVNVQARSLLAALEVV